MAWRLFIIRILTPVVSQTTELVWPTIFLISKTVVCFDSADGSPYIQPGGSPDDGCDNPLSKLWVWVKTKFIESPSGKFKLITRTGRKIMEPLPNSYLTFGERKPGIKINYFTDGVMSEFSRDASDIIKLPTNINGMPVEVEIHSPTTRGGEVHLNKIGSSGYTLDIWPISPKPVERLLVGWEIHKNIHLLKAAIPLDRGILYSVAKAIDMTLAAHTSRVLAISGENSLCVDVPAYGWGEATKINLEKLQKLPESSINLPWHLPAHMRTTLLQQTTQPPTWVTTLNLRFWAQSQVEFITVCKHVIESPYIRRVMRDDQKAIFEKLASSLNYEKAVASPSMSPNEPVEYTNTPWQEAVKSAHYTPCTSSDGFTYLALMGPSTRSNSNEGEGPKP